jgi:hypothetical protein
MSRYWWDNVGTWMAWLLLPYGIKCKSVIPLSESPHAGWLE